MHGSGKTTLIISNGKINDIMEIVQALEDSNILRKGVTEKIKNETKKQNGGFLGKSLGTFRSKFFRKHISRKRNSKSCLWK